MPVNWDNIVLAHAKWKRELHSAIETNEKLDASNVGKDNLCEMGKWIYGEGSAYANLPAYIDLKQKHAKFHALVADVITKMRSLPQGEALELIGLNSEFSRASSDCINAIVALKVSVN